MSGNYSGDYVENCIKEALELAGGSESRARAQIMSWAAEDMRLLMGLARPHLSGIVAHRMERVKKGQGGDVAPRANPSQAAPSGNSKAQQGTKRTSTGHTPSGRSSPVGALPPMDAFAKDLLKAVTSRDAAVFGQESYAAPVERKQASQRHQDILRAMAARNQFKKI